ncbi:MAG: DUF222 domain-containing protein [Propionibacteriaceae bacterium]|nr:DUF222 domain-containing protein [Propionibacteriaceae bacterium]
MTVRNVHLTTSQALAEVAALLDRIDPDRSVMEPRARLDCARLARTLTGRLEALADLLLAEADQTQASLRVSGTPTSSWLGMDQRWSKREAAGALHRAKELAQHPSVGEAATKGRIGSGQARAISRLLDQLSPQLQPGEQRRAEEVLVDLAATMDADQLAKAAGQVLSAVAPSRANELHETRLQREAEDAHRNRSLRFFREAGSVRFDGSLPRVEAEAWLVLLDAHAESLRRTAVETRDPLAEVLTPEQRRADALIAMIGRHQVTRQAPSSGGDRPRVLVSLDYARLLEAAAGAGLISTDEPISAGELRRLTCDADIIPAVLGGQSEVLDVGREHRLVTPAIRTALHLRDGGCAFPTCHTRPAVCEAHHIQPWWAGGRTELANLVLLCHHHHALVEPARYGTRDQWEVRIALDGTPEFLPPARLDTDRSPMRRGRSPAEPGREEGGSRAGPRSAA